MNLYSKKDGKQKKRASSVVQDAKREAKSLSVLISLELFPSSQNSLILLFLHGSSGECFFRKSTVVKKKEKSFPPGPIFYMASRMKRF